MEIDFSSLWPWFFAGMLIGFFLSEIATLIGSTIARVVIWLRRDD